MSGNLIAFPGGISPLMKLVEAYVVLLGEIPVEEFAALEFEPSPGEETAQMVADFSQGRWEQEWRVDGNHAVSLRLTAVIVSKTKAELIEAAEGLGEPCLAELIDNLNHTRERFEALARLLRSAESRQMSAAAVVALRLSGGPPKSKRRRAGSASPAPPP